MSAAAAAAAAYSLLLPTHCVCADAVNEADEMSRRCLGGAGGLTHYGEELHINHNIMFKNAYLTGWPNKGMDDPCPMSLCNKFRYIVQVRPPPPPQPPHTHHHCAAAVRNMGPHLEGRAGAAAGAMENPPASSAGEVGYADRCSTGGTAAMGLTADLLETHGTVSC